MKIKLILTLFLFTVSPLGAVTSSSSYTPIYEKTTNNKVSDLKVKTSSTSTSTSGGLVSPISCPSGQFLEAVDSQGNAVCKVASSTTTALPTVNKQCGNCTNYKKIIKSKYSTNICTYTHSGLKPGLVDGTKYTYDPTVKTGKTAMVKAKCICNTSTGVSYWSTVLQNSTSNTCPDYNYNGINGYVIHL
jgi:hypothetical protein